MGDAIEAVTKCPTCGATASAPCIHVVKMVLGDLIDALHDELRYEASNSSAVMEEIQNAIALLGPEYKGYRQWL
jgi:hypothetical protein